MIMTIFDGTCHQAIFAIYTYRLKVAEFNESAHLTIEGFHLLTHSHRGSLGFSLLNTHTYYIMLKKPQIRRE